jgi:hypothetical protein
VRKSKSKPERPEDPWFRSFPFALAGLILLILVMPEISVISGLSSPRITGFGMFVGGIFLVTVIAYWLSAHWARRLRSGIMAKNIDCFVELVKLKDASRKPAKLWAVWITDEALALQSRETKQVVSWADINAVELHSSSVLQVITIHLQTGKLGQLEIELMQKDGVLVAQGDRPHYFADEIRSRLKFAESAEARLGENGSPLKGPF